MKHKLFRTLSVFLAALMLSGIVAVLPVGAATTSDNEEAIDWSTVDFGSTPYYSPADKLKTMTLYYSKGNYNLYFHEYTGECALENIRTGEVTFSNPYDIGNSTGAPATKKQLLSQIAIRYTGVDGTNRNFYSYEEAAQRQQISIERIKTGVRVEYTLGDENARKLVPKMISAHSMEEHILIPCQANGVTEFLYKKLTGFYVLHDISQMTSQTAIEQELKKYPLLEKMAIYILDTKATTVEMRTLEGIIKQYAPDYTYEQMDEDYAEVEYVDESAATAVFSMALEYSLNEDGMTVRLPANGIRFNSTLYTLNSISILPYFGAGNSHNSGYTFYPDGSGALFCFEDLKDVIQTTNVRNAVYSTDYAYHTISGKYQQAIRYPVFGIHEEQSFYEANVEFTPKDKKGNVTGDPYDEIVSMNQTMINSEAAFLAAINAKGNAVVLSDVTEKTVQRGFFAVIEEGESLAEIATYHGGSTSDYNTVMTYFNPRPTDSYEVNDVISVSDQLQSGTSVWNVTSDRKYSGNLKIRYIMLSEEDDNAGNQLYSTDYNGMAKAYQDYLLDNGTFTRLSEADVQKDIPLFIETFGCLEGEIRVATIPLTVLRPLTSFEDIQSMYEDLQSAGIRNVLFQMRGYVNGGMYPTVPGKLKWENAVGGKSGFKDLLDYAKEVNAEEGNNLGLYPDFDFVWMKDNGGGFKMKRDAIKTIDNRYTKYRKYSPTYQRYIKDVGLAVAPSAFSRFTEKLLKNYSKYDIDSISVSTLGQFINSDFDKKEPYNREDDKEFTVNAVKSISDAVSSVMVTGGNAITWKYVDYIVEAPMVSSCYSRASREVPFFGLVAHGYMQYAGSAANMDGDTRNAVLKAIENGGSIFFMLSYENTKLLKEDFYYSEYYSVDYDIWSEDVKAAYLDLNNQMSDVQTKLLINHEFLSGHRVPDVDELIADLANELAGNYDAELSKYENEEAEKALAVNTARELLINGVAQAQGFADSQKKSADDLNKSYSKIGSSADSLKEKLEAFNATTEGTTAYSRAKSAYETAKKDLGTKFRSSMNSVVNGEGYTESYRALLKNAEEAVAFLADIDGMLASVLEEANGYLEQIRTLSEAIETNAELFANRKKTMQDTLALYMTAVEIASYTPAAKNTNSDSTTTVVEKTEETEVFDKLLSDDGNIVAVTYGGKGGDDAVPFKSFIINYNSYDVVVEYNGILYTVPSGDYVAIYR